MHTRSSLCFCSVTFVTDSIPWDSSSFWKHIFLPSWKLLKISHLCVNITIKKGSQKRWWLFLVYFPNIHVRYIAYLYGKCLGKSTKHGLFGFIGKNHQTAQEDTTREASVGPLRVNGLPRRNRPAARFWLFKGWIVEVLIFFFEVRFCFFEVMLGLFTKDALYRHPIGPGK